MPKFRRRISTLLRRRPYLNGRWHKIYPKKGRREFDRFDLVLWMPEDLTAIILEKQQTVSGFPAYRIKVASTEATFNCYGNELVLLKHQPLLQRKRKRHVQNNSNIRAAAAANLPVSQGNKAAGNGANTSIQRKSKLHPCQPSRTNPGRNKAGKEKGVTSRKRKAVRTGSSLAKTRTKHKKRYYKVGMGRSKPTKVETNDKGKVI